MRSLWLVCIQILCCLTSSLIPKVLHRTFIYSNVVDKSSEFNLCYKAFAAHNHDFEIKLWLKRDIMKLMNEKELALYNSLPHDIQRADLARYLILYHHGGYYSDLDVYTFDSWSKLVDTFANISDKAENLCILLEEWHHSNKDLLIWENSTFRSTYFPMKYRRPTDIQLSNYWMATTKYHPYFKLILNLLHERADIPVDIGDVQQILWTSGPGMISDAYYHLYLENKTIYNNDRNQVITISRDKWFGQTSCAAVYHIFHIFNLADYYPDCAYLYHLGHGSWKMYNWCQIDPVRCILHYFGLGSILCIPISIYYYKCKGKLCRGKQKI